MKTNWILAVLFMIILILGCSAKEETTKNTVEQNSTASTQQTQTTTTVAQQPAPVSEKILVADTENQRVIEIDKSTKAITWQYGCNEIFQTGRCDYGTENNQLYQPTSALYTNGNILIADKGNDRVIELNKNKQIIWTYTDLKEPVYAYPMKSGDILITDSLNNRVIEVDASGDKVWQFGCTYLTVAQKCAAGKDDTGLNVPASAIELDNGNILITDKGNNRVIEVKKNEGIVFEYKTGLIMPAFATKSGSDYMIANTNANKIYLVSQDGNLISETDSLDHPLHAQQLNNGDIFITDSSNNRLIELDKDGKIVWYYGDCYENADGQPDPDCKIGAVENQLFKPSSAIIG